MSQQQKRVKKSQILEIAFIFHTVSLPSQHVSFTSPALSSQQRNSEALCVVRASAAAALLVLLGRRNSICWARLRLRQQLPPLLSRSLNYSGISCSLFWTVVVSPHRGSKPVRVSLETHVDYESTVSSIHAAAFALYELVHISKGVLERDFSTSEFIAVSSSKSSSLLNMCNDAGFTVEAEQQQSWQRSS